MKKKVLSFLMVLLLFCTLFTTSAETYDDQLVWQENQLISEMQKPITYDEYPELFTQELHSLEPSKELPFTFTPSTYKDGQAVITVSSNEYKDFELSISLYGEQYEKEETHIDISDHTFRVAVNQDYAFYIRSEIGDTIYNYVGIITPAAFSSRDFRYDVVIKTKNVDSFVRNKSEIPSHSNKFSREEIETLRAAGTIVESEPNNSASQANRIYDDYDVFGRIVPQNEVDWFVVSFSSAGNANFWLGNIPSGCDYDLYLVDSNGTTVLAGSYGVESSELITYYVQPNINYYIWVRGVSGTSNAYYWLRAKNYPVTPPPPSYGDQYEPNDTFSTATLISPGYLYANISPQTDNDYYKIYISSYSTVTVTLDNIPYGCDYDLKLLNSTGYGELGSSTNGGNISEEITTTLTSGTYYIRVFSYQGTSTSNYRLGVSISQSQQYGTLIYNGNGNATGTVPPQQTYVVGSSVFIRENSGGLWRQGFYFQGWNANTHGTGRNYPVNSYATLTTPSTLIYAKWRGTDYWSGGLASGVSNLTYNHNATTSYWNSYIRPAIEAWNDAIPQVNISPTSSQTPSIRIVIKDYGQHSGQYGVMYPYASNGVEEYSIIEATGLNHEVTSWTRCVVEIYKKATEDANFADWQKTSNITHELGHALSLRHPENHSEVSIMRQTANTSIPQCPVPQNCDIFNLRTKWGN